MNQVACMVEKKESRNVIQIKIGELSQLSGVSVSTLYDYLRTGLLPLPGKESPTKAYFSQVHLDRLKEIKQLKDNGLPLSEIRELFSRNREAKEEAWKTSDDVRLAIVDKALELFSRFHYENTKISDITEALDMGNGTFYRYFKSKEELFLDCLERLPKALVPRDAWAEVDKEPDFILRLKKRGYAMLNAFPSYIGILNYAKLSLGKKDLTLSKKAAECIQSLVRPLQNDLEQAIKEGHIREVDAELCAYLLLGINETFGYLLLMDPQYSVEKGFAGIEDFITHALARRHRIPAKEGIAQITDTSGHVIGLKELRFNGNNYLEGRYLEGTLQVPVSDIESIEIHHMNDTLMADVTHKKTGKIKLALLTETEISGRTPFGVFSISALKLKHIGIFELDNVSHMG